MKRNKEIPLTSVLNWHPDLKDVISDIEHKSLIRKSGGEVTVGEDGQVDVIMTTQTVDRDGDVIITAGVNIDYYNMVIAWNHDLSVLPIGKMLEINRTATEMTGKLEFAMDYDFAADCAYLVKGKYMRGVSIGYIPMEVITRSDSRFAPACAKYGIDARKCKRILTKVELIELSLCPVQCNPNCRVKAFDMDQIVTPEGKSLANKMSKSEDGEGYDMSLEDRLVRIEEMLLALTTPHTVTLESTQEATQDAPGETGEVEDVKTQENVQEAEKAVSDVPGTTVLIQDEEECKAEETMTPDPTEDETGSGITTSQLQERVEEMSTEKVENKPIEIKVLRVGGLKTDQSITKKALKYLQGKPF